MTTTANNPEIAATKFSAEEIESTYRKVMWRIMPLIFICYVVNYVDRVNIALAKIQFIVDLHFSEAVYGLGAGVFFVGFLLCEVPSNLMLGRIGARKTLLRIMALWGMVCALTMFVTTPLHFYVARLLLGASEAGFFPGVLLILTYWFPSARRARMTSICFMSNPVAVMIGTPLAGWIIHTFGGMNGWKGWQWMFLLEGLPAVALGIVVYNCLSDSPASAKWLSDRQKQILLEPLEREDKRKPIHGRQSLLKNLLDPRVLILGSVSFCQYVLANTLAYWTPTVIHNSGIVKITNVGILSAVPAAFAVVIMILVSRHSDKTLERRWHFAIAISCAALAITLLPIFSHNPAVSVALLAIASAGHYSSLSVFFTIPSAYLPKTGAAGGIAMVTTIGACGAALTPMLQGWARTATGSMSLGLHAASAMIFLGAVILLIGVPARVLTERAEMKVAN